MKKKERFKLVIVLGLLSALGPFSIDMYLPGFPAIAQNLNTTVDYVSYSLSSFLIGVCTGQFIWGPLLDRFGRKPPLYAGLAIYILASLGCALSSSITMLIGFRFLQALGGCAGMIAPRAIVRDIFPVKESAKVFSLLILILGASPIIAPTVGSFMVTAFGWHSVFIVLAAVTAILLIVVIFLLPESKRPNPSFSLKPKPILLNFFLVIKTPQFYSYALAGAVASASLMAYISGSPLVFMEIFGLKEHQYSLIFAFIAVGLIGSSQLNNFLLKKYSNIQIIKTMLLTQTGIGVFLVAGTLSGLLGLNGTVILVFLFLSCQGFIGPNTGALSMAPFSKQAGSASALMGAMQTCFGAIVSAVVGWLSNGTALPMLSMMMGCALLSLILLTIGHKSIVYKSRGDVIQEQVYELIEKY
jgi:DHA1 family bicyclomycin/chloramphenicol resistance-like MFS transporter